MNNKETKNYLSPLVKRKNIPSYNNFKAKGSFQNFNHQLSLQDKRNNSSSKNKYKIGLSSNDIEESNLYHKRSYLERYEKIKQLKMSKRRTMSVSGNSTKRTRKEQIKVIHKKAHSMINSPISNKRISFSITNSEMFNKFPQSQLKEYQLKTPNKIIWNGNNNVSAMNSKRPSKDLLSYLYSGNNNMRINNNSSGSISFAGSTSNNSKYAKFININYNQFEIVHSNKLQITNIKKEEENIPIIEKEEGIIKKLSYSDFNVSNKENTFSFDNNLDSSRHVQPIRQSEQCHFNQPMPNVMLTGTLPSRMQTEQENELKPSDFENESVKPIKEDTNIALAYNDIMENSIEESFHNQMNSTDEVILSDLFSNINSQIEIIKTYPKLPMNICRVFLHMNNQNIYYINHLTEGNSMKSNVIMVYRLKILLKNFNMLSLITKEYEDKTSKNYNKSRNTPMIDMKTMNDILGENLTILNEIMNEGVNIIKGRIDN